jgi:hypothetical protein
MLLIFPVLLLGYLLLGLIVSIGVARWSSSRFQSKFAPWAVFAVLFALFFGDEIYGYWHWQNLCKTEGGLHVYKRVPVEGFRYMGGSADVAADGFLKSGYGFLEGTYSGDYDDKAGRLYRYSPAGDGQLNRTMITQLKSRFTFSSDSAVPYPHYAWAYETYIKDSLSGEMLGVGRQFGYRGATVVRYFRAITGADREGSSESCGDNNPSQLIAQTIPPIQANLKEMNHD